ncbi:hypothetical protein, partial [Burkholderia pseudomallei]
VMIDGKEVVVASASLVLRGDRHKGFRLVLGATDTRCHGLGYYADLLPLGPFPGEELVGYLRHEKCDLGTMFAVTGTYATNADGTSRLEVSIERAG